MEQLTEVRGSLPFLFCAFIALLSLRCAYEAWRRHRMELPSVPRHALTASLFALIAPLPVSPVMGTLPVLAAMGVALLSLEMRQNKYRKAVDAVAGAGLLACLFLLMIGISPVTAYGPSMWPTAPSGWSIALVDLRAYSAVPPDRGEQVQMWVPRAPHGKVIDVDREWPSGRYHKRVFALAGDHVQISMKSLTVNGIKVGDCTVRGASVPLDRWMCAVSMPKLSGEVANYEVVWGDPMWLSNPVDMIVPPGHVFLLGDNLTESADSRDRGVVPASWVVGRTL